MKKIIMLELDDEMKDIEGKIVSILPHDEAKAMAIMLHLTNILKNEFGVEDEMIIEETAGAGE